MKNLRSIFIGLVGLLFALQVGLVSNASAQSLRQVERERINRVMDANANVEEFRQELINYFTEMEDAARLLNEIPAVRKKLNQDGLRAFETIAGVKQQIARTGSEDLILMRAAYANFPGWRETPRTINALIKPELRRQLEARLAAKQNGGGVQSDFVTPDDCAPAITSDVSNSDIAAAQAASLAAHAIADAVPPILNIPAVAAYAITDAIVIGLVTSKAIKDDCTALGASGVQTIVDGAKTAIIDNESFNKTAILNNDDTNKDTIINSLNTKTANITTAITSAQNAVINNDNSNKTMLTTAITNAKADIISNDNSNKTMLTTAINDAQTSITTNGSSSTTALTTAITNAQNTIVNNDNGNKTMIVNNDNGNKTLIINNDNANALTLNTNLTNAKNAIITNDNTNTTNIVNNDNSNKTMIVNSNAANKNELRDLLLRTQIEANLAAGGGDDDDEHGTPVGLYVMPQAQGGYLELVRSIVVDTITKLAGTKTNRANTYLQRGDSRKAAGDFKAAYAEYRKAYRTAVSKSDDH